MSRAIKKELMLKYRIIEWAMRKKKSERLKILARIGVPRVK